jgi:predicted small metal-binding protein
MAKFKCKDIGQTCNFEIQDDNQDEMMSIIAMHADKTHNIKSPPPELIEKIKEAITK